MSVPPLYALTAPEFQPNLARQNTRVGAFQQKIVHWPKDSVSEVLRQPHL